MSPTKYICQRLDGPTLVAPRLPFVFSPAFGIIARVSALTAFTVLPVFVTMAYGVIQDMVSHTPAIRSLMANAFLLPVGKLSSRQNRTRLSGGGGLGSSGVNDLTMSL